MLLSWDIVVLTSETTAQAPAARDMNMNVVEKLGLGRLPPGRRGFVSEHAAKAANNHKHDVPWSGTPTEGQSLVQGEKASRRSVGPRM